MRTHSEIIMALVIWGLSWSCTGKNLNEPVVQNHFFTVDENTPAGTIFGVVDAYDLDNGSVLSYVISEEDDDGTFDLDSHGGHLSVADPARLDYELNDKIRFTVVVSDNGDPVLESTATVTVTLNDLNEFAPVVEDQSFEIAPGATKDELIGMVLATDEEAHQGILYYILSGNESDQVALDNQTGSLTVNDPAAFAAALEQPMELSIMVRDMHIDSKTDTALISIKVKL